MSDGHDPAPATPEPPAAPRPEDLIGRMIADRYRLDAVIGRGGMATIFRATDTRLGRPVALKLLRPEISADRDLADRFRREALAATVLRHGNIVPCLDTGSDPAGPFLVMELIDGEDLAARLRRTGALSVAEVARLGLDISRALGVAHIRGIVHRDVKPGNILLARDGRALITDFGIARLAADAEGAPGTTLGSVQYFSPEQAQGAATTPASDIYGLGLVMYEALTGRRPWRGDTPGQLALARVGKPAPSPRDVRGDVPVDLDAVVRRALAPDPESRFSSGAAMAGFLEPLVGQGDPTVRVQDARVAGRPGPAAALRPSRVTQASRRSGRGRRIAAVVVAAIALLAAGRWALAALPTDGDGSKGPAASAASASRAPGGAATARPSATAEADREAHGETHRQADAEAAPKTPVAASPVCEPFLGLACSLEAGPVSIVGVRSADRVHGGEGLVERELVARPARARPRRGLADVRQLGHGPASRGAAAGATRRRRPAPWSMPSRRRRT